jgi:dTDP-N-acetylfucosamine:lipid II N-acetylfucosaminyltransferase
MRTLHLANDDKFLPYVQAVFEEVFPGRNEFRVPGDPARAPRFLRPGPGVIVKGPEYWESEHLRSDAAAADLVLVHFMTPQFVEALRRIPADVAAMWVGWGADFYDLIVPYLPRLVLPQTAALAAGVEWRWRLRHGPRRLAGAVARRLGVHPRSTLPPGANEPLAAGIRSIASRLDFVWFIPPELELIRRALPDLRAENHRICYYSAEHVFDPGPAEWKGPDILAGNSATVTNNHAELFRVLARHDLDGRRVVTPLSYGDEGYARGVERLGRRVLGDRFVPLRRFMPQDEYAGRLARCGTVVMNHVRQQGGTTVATALYKGARVYAREDSPMFSFYTRMGLRLRGVDTELAGTVRPFEPPTPDEHARHRRILSEYWGHERALEQVRRLGDRVATMRRTRSGTTRLAPTAPRRG